MAETDIKTISISVSTDTKAARQNIDVLVRSLQRLVDMVASIKTVGGSIDSMAKGLDALGKIDLQGLPEQMSKIAAAMSELTHLDFQQTRSLNAQAKMLSAQNREKELAIREKTAATEAEAEARKKEMLRLGIFRSGKTKSGEEQTNTDWENRWDRKELGSWSWKAFGDDVSTANAKMLEAANGSFHLMNVLKPLLSVAAKAGVAFAKMSAHIGKIAGKVAIAPFKKLASSIGGVVKKLSGFFAAVKRIAIYRAIRTALKEIAQGFKEGVDNLYQYSKAINGQFAKSMDMIATSALYAKNSLGAMSAPIINTLAPAVDMITDKFVDLLNTINELIASMTGASTWTAALKYPKEYAEDLDSAAGSAKKLRATLLGFDEINRLDDNSKGSRGRAGEELDYSKMFEERTVSNQAKGVIQSLKEAFASGDLTELGVNVGEAIKRGLDNIDWNSIKEKFNSHAKLIGTFINGLVSVEGLGSSLGATIAEVLNVAVGKLNTFYHTVKWDKVGTFIGEGFNSILSTFDIVKLGDTLATIINSAVSMVGNFINKVNWNKIGEFLSKGINKFFNEANTKELARTICNGIIGALQAVSSFLRNTDFEQIGQKIGQFLKGIKWKEIIFETVSVVLNAISAAARLIWGLIEELFGGIGRWFVNVFTTAWNGIKTAWSGVTAWFANLYQGIINGFKGIGLFFRDKFVEAKQGVTNAFASVGTFFADKATAVKSSFTNIGTWFKDKFNGAARGVKDAFSSIGLFFSDTWSNIKGAFKDTVSWFQQKFESVWRAIKEPFKQVGLFFSDIWDTIKKKFTDIGQNIGNAVGKAFATAINAVLTAVEKVINAPIKAINALLDTVNKLPGVSIGKLDKITLKKLDVDKYSNGGSPETGSVFIAGERGAEIVASNGGHTQVANRDQIANSVALGMEAANEDTLAELRKQNELLRIIASKDFSPVTNITTDSITNALNRQNRRVGATVIPVGG